MTACVLTGEAWTSKRKKGKGRYISYQRGRGRRRRCQNCLVCHAREHEKEADSLPPPLLLRNGNVLTLRK